MSSLRDALTCRPAQLVAPLVLLANRVVASSSARRCIFIYTLLRSSLAPNTLLKLETYSSSFRKNSLTYSKSSGFTLVELLVISPIILVTLMTALTFLFNQYGHLVKQNGQLDLQLEAQNILFGLQDDLWYANAFTSDLNSNLIDTYQPGGGWTYNTTPQTLIISTPALTKNHRDPNRQPVYINESSCTPPDGNGENSALYNNVVYFVSGTNFYKRNITAPSNLALCGTSYIKQNCPAGHTSSSCPLDITLSSHLNALSIVYYDTNNTTTTTPEAAESVRVSMNLKDKAFGEDISASSSIRLRKLNQ